MGNTTENASTRSSAIVLIIGIATSAALAVALALGYVGDPVVAKKDVKKSDQQGNAAADDVFDPQRDYDQTRASDEVRAYHGAIFFARVDALEGEDQEPSGGTAPAHHVQHYLATVDRSLVGPVSGQIRIIYLGAYDMSFESGGYGPLRIGERYLFFAGGPANQPPTEPQTEFYVQAGTGTILITSDRQEQELVDKYLPLIAQADAHEREVEARATAWAEAREDRAGITPSVTINPEQGAPGTEVTRRGENFGFMEATITFGEERTFADVAINDGSFRTQITIPKDATQGAFPIVIDDQQGFETNAVFTVTE